MPKRPPKKKRLYSPRRRYMEHNYPSADDRDGPPKPKKEKKEK